MSAVLTIGIWVVVIGGLLVRCRQIQREIDREARLLHLARVEWVERDRMERTIPLAGVPDRHPARRPLFYECERIWQETLAWGLEPDRDLLAEWERAR